MAALKDPIAKAHEHHIAFTRLRGLFLEPLDNAREDVRSKVKVWQKEEERKAEELRCKLQAEADEKARREREALEKRAAQVKTEAKREELLSRAADVAAPVVNVTANKAAGFRTQKRWKVTEINQKAFIQAATQDPSLLGFIDISATALERAKTANAMAEWPGVKFELRSF